MMTCRHRSGIVKLSELSSYHLEWRLCDERNQKPFERRWRWPFLYSMNIFFWMRFIWIRSRLLCVPRCYIKPFLNGFSLLCHSRCHWRRPCAIISANLQTIDVSRIRLNFCLVVGFPPLRMGTAHDPFHCSGKSAICQTWLIRFSRRILCSAKLCRVVCIMASGPVALLTLDSWSADGCFLVFYGIVKSGIPPGAGHLWAEVSGSFDKFFFWDKEL